MFEPSAARYTLILPVGEIDADILEALDYRISECFGEPVRTAPGTGVPQHPYREDRGQYDGKSILDEMVELPPTAGATRVLGITGCDIFSGTLRFIFGMSSETYALVSLFRLRPEFYGQASSTPVLIRRVITEAVHEIGHTYGLRHCTDPRCAMYFSGTVVDTDRKRPDFCPAHRRILESAQSR